MEVMAKAKGTVQRGRRIATPTLLALLRFKFFLPVACFFHGLCFSSLLSGAEDHLLLLSEPAL